jgi:hypothetical protein
MEMYGVDMNLFFEPFEYGIQFHEGGGIFPEAYFSLGRFPTYKPHITLRKALLYLGRGHQVLAFAMYNNMQIVL